MGMPKRVISIMAALPDEIRHFCRRHRLKRRPGRRSGWSGIVAGQEVEVHCTGVGAECARRGLDRVLAGGRPAAMMFVGSAGALTGSLAVGDLVLADRLVSADDSTEVRWTPTSIWFDRALTLAKARIGPVLTTRRIVTTATAKRRLALVHALETETAAVDMESHTWATCASQANLPFVVLKAISDTLDEDLPLDFNDALRADGSLSRARVVAAAVRQPSAVPGLLELRDRVKLCSRVLEQALVTVLG